MLRALILDSCQKTFLRQKEKCRDNLRNMKAIKLRKTTVKRGYPLPPVEEYDIDGIRLDTTPYMPLLFSSVYGGNGRSDVVFCFLSWKGFLEATFPRFFRFLFFSIGCNCRFIYRFPCFLPALISQSRTQGLENSPFLESADLSRFRYGLLKTGFLPSKTIGSRKTTQPVVPVGI